MHHNPAMHPQMERLYRAAREVQGINGPAALARALNASPQTVNNWESRGISKQGLLVAQRVLSCSASWIETGQGPMLVTEASNVSPAAVGSRRIPLISYVQAGLWTDAADPYAVGDAADWLMTDLDISSSSFALEIKGDSMLPEFKPGDRVIIDPNIAPQPGDFVVAKNGDHEATFKKYRPRGIGPDGKDVFELVPLNEDYPTIRSDATPVRIVGTMVEHRKYRRRP